MTEAVFSSEANCHRFLMSRLKNNKKRDSLIIKYKRGSISIRFSPHIKTSKAAPNGISLHCQQKS